MRWDNPAVFRPETVAIEPSSEGATLVFNHPGWLEPLRVFLPLGSALPLLSGTLLMRIREQTGMLKGSFIEENIGY